MDSSLLANIEVSSTQVQDSNQFQNPALALAAEEVSRENKLISLQTNDPETYQDTTSKTSEIASAPVESESTLHEAIAPESAASTDSAPAEQNKLSNNPGQEIRYSTRIREWFISRKYRLLVLLIVISLDVLWAYLALTSPSGAERYFAIAGVTTLISLISLLFKGNIGCCDSNHFVPASSAPTDESEQLIPEKGLRRNTEPQVLSAASRTVPGYPPDIPGNSPPSSLYFNHPLDSHVEEAEIHENQSFEARHIHHDMAKSVDSGLLINSSSSNEANQQTSQLAVDPSNDLKSETLAKSSSGNPNDLKSETLPKSTSENKETSEAVEQIKNLEGSTNEA